MNIKIRQQLQKDRKLKPLIALIKLPRYPAHPEVYNDLIRSIVSQQLSGKAASTIYGRFLDLFPNRYPEPKKLLRLSIEELRACGLSNSKAHYIQNVATFFQAEKIQEKNWKSLSDEEIIDYLCQIKGVGKWTVKMILMFSLRRPDVLPLEDLVVKQMMIKLYKPKETGKDLDKKLHKIAEKWQPYRSYACRLLWRWKDTILTK